MHLLIETDSGAYVQLTQTKVSNSGRSRASRVSVHQNVTTKPANKTSRTRSTRHNPKTVYMNNKVVKDYGGLDTVVGTWVSDMKLVRQKFTYSKSADTSLGFAVSPTGKAGTFRFGGPSRNPQRLPSDSERRRVWVGGASKRNFDMSNGTTSGALGGSATNPSSSVPRNGEAGRQPQRLLDIARNTAPG